ncbi:WD repeat-containing protein on Y chromosome-like [Sitophilus oryzae]|uniref:WD repeat-containing protein on Y chromosome-like n=1 Tax=Sitophilus oryzae TaxID=7048 RepID=A0A6J2Y035_SITOR|nr:WD repeat-containing protein on Y chromosome-like [Sitophilus oryzae]
MADEDNIIVQIKELDKVSLDVTEEDSRLAWHGLVQNLSNSDLEWLRAIFKSNVEDDDENGETGLDKNEFLNAISTLYGDERYSLQSQILFTNIAKENDRITWDNFLDFLIDNMCPDVETKLKLDLVSIEHVTHTKNESVAKIVLIETDKYFCYAIILKHGRVGLYDGNLNFLTSYHAIMTREDISRPEDERRRRNRWVTDALFCPDTLLFIITNSARTIVIYEASGLKHVPCWLIISTPNILETVAYKPYKKFDADSTKCVLFAGDCNGEIMSMVFHQPGTSLLRKKRTDDISLFYWEDFLKEKDYVTVKNYGKVHESGVNHIEYFAEKNILLSSSEDSNASVVVKYLNNKRKSAYYKIPKGVGCFAMSTQHKILITGSFNGIIRLWNFLISKAIYVVKEHSCQVVDLKVLDRQEIFIGCFWDGIVKIWDLKEYSCLQTLKLKFPSFAIHGKVIEWGINCIYPGPKRQQPGSGDDAERKKECFGINDIDEKKIESKNDKLREHHIFERSFLLVSCCNHIAKVRMNFNESSIELGFSYPILPPPPLQNSVLIPTNWGLQNEAITTEKFDRELNANVKKQLEELSFILDKNILEERDQRSDINYKIAILESKKEQMKAKVALGAPYLALDIANIQELSLPQSISCPSRKKSKKYADQIKQLLANASNKDEIFSEPSSSRSKSNRSSIVEFPL